MHGPSKGGSCYGYCRPNSIDCLTCHCASGPFPQLQRKKQNCKPLCRDSCVHSLSLLLWNLTSDITCEARIFTSSKVTVGLLWTNLKFKQAPLFFSMGCQAKESSDCGDRSVWNVCHGLGWVGCWWWGNNWKTFIYPSHTQKENRNSLQFRAMNSFHNTSRDNGVVGQQ